MSDVKDEIKIDILATPEILEYYEGIRGKVEKQFEMATLARQKGLDHAMEVETKPASDVADRTEKIIGPKGIAVRYREVYKENKGNRTKAIFQIFKEIIEEKWCAIPDREKRLEQAIKTALMLNTEGVVIAPIDGVPKVAISKNFDGSEYVDIYYAGPIRAAGGTSTVLPLILGDYGRKLMGLDRYKPTEDEIERYIEETQLYEEIFTRQYRLKAEEVRKIILGVPVCINGEPTEEKEVVVNRDLKRVVSNRVRGGACLVISEGIALKARKILNFARMLELNWQWLEEIISVGKEDKGKKAGQIDAKYLEGVAAGRPIFCYPSRPGGFRLRYGRSRGAGIMAKAVHPATMYLLDEFIAIGTQVKLEKPGKATSVTACDSMEGPIVRLKNGNVIQAQTVEQALAIKDQVERVLFLGDLLVAYGDFRFTAHPLLPAGFTEEEWSLLMEKAMNEKNSTKNEGSFPEQINKVSFEKAWEISTQWKVPLHPKFTAYYSVITPSEFIEFIKILRIGKQGQNGNGNLELRWDMSAAFKQLLEKMGIQHKAEQGDICISGDFAHALVKTFSIPTEWDESAFTSCENSMAIVNAISPVEIRDKAGTFLGARMGRPESSSERDMKGKPHGLFPIGNYGSSTRSINKAVQKNNGKIDVEISVWKCMNCNTRAHSATCTQCGQRTVKLHGCKKCGREFLEEMCPACKTRARSYMIKTVDIGEELQRALNKLNIKLPDIVKGVKGVINQDRIVEPLEKAILRARQNVHLFRDGTIRYELINLPLTHFKPKEISTPIETLIKLGYRTDMNGKSLEHEDQVLELKPQDIIVHEGCGEFFVRVAQFLDEELERFYKQTPHYHAHAKEDLVGEIVLGLAPHTSAAIAARILGYTKARACFAHPFFHQCKRRNCDGEQDSYMLLLDGLLNFSEAYLPESRGGRMDAPLVFTVALKPTEIDDEVYNMEVSDRYPLDLYEKARLRANPDSVQGIELVAQRLNTIHQYSGFKYTHESNRFEEGPKYSQYVQMKTMEDKIRKQAQLQSKIQAVDARDSIERVLVSHFLPDCIGNVRAFSRQKFRCTNCNAKYRRIPLTGKCHACKEGHLILTIAEGSVRKYITIAKDMIVEYKLSDYLRQRMDLVEEEVNSVFNEAPKEQRRLSEFF